MAEKHGMEIGGIIGDEKTKVIKTIPCKKEWLKDFKDLKATSDLAVEMKNKAQTLSRAIWAKIEIDLNDFSTDMRLNEETGEIEVLGREDGTATKGAKKSPYFQK